MIQPNSPFAAPPDEIPELESGDHLTIEEFERRYQAMPELKKAELIEGIVYIPLAPEPPTWCVAPAKNGQAIPELEAGDHLTIEEFERRYEAMPFLKKAELIEGAVFMPSPVRVDRHASPDAYLVMWSSIYASETPGAQTAANATVRLRPRNEYQPDAALLILPECGGRVRKDEKNYLVGGPEWVGEVSSSTVSIDLGFKQKAYRENGVQEYLVWRVNDSAIDWFILKDSDYVRLPPEANGVLKSQVFPGLWLDAPALIMGDIVAVRRCLERGLASPEHAEFVAKLAAQRKA